jgi:hypothetical protein
MSNFKLNVNSIIMWQRTTVRLRYKLLTRKVDGRSVELGLEVVDASGQENERNNKDTNKDRGDLIFWSAVMTVPSCGQS